LIVLSVTILALFVAMMIALVRESLERAKEDPRFADRVQLFQFYLRGGHKS